MLFNGTNGGPEPTAIYQRWVEENRDIGRTTGSRVVNVRTALIEYFRDHATILLGTEAAAEGINLQFCSLVVNYDYLGTHSALSNASVAATATARNTMWW